MSKLQGPRKRSCQSKPNGQDGGDEDEDDDDDDDDSDGGRRYRGGGGDDEDGGEFTLSAHLHKRAMEESGFRKGSGGARLDGLHGVDGALPTKPKKKKERQKHTGYRDESVGGRKHLSSLPTSVAVVPLSVCVRRARVRAC